MLEVLPASLIINHFKSTANISFLTSVTLSWNYADEAGETELNQIADC